MHRPLIQPQPTDTDRRAGLALRVRGQVQGVGFRPTVWHVARQLGLTGEVCNDGEGVWVQLYGPTPQLEAFEPALYRACPPLARIERIDRHWVDYLECPDFSIRPSRGGTLDTPITPDAATCSECLAEIRDPGNRRHGYAFTNCTHCGPRLSIVRRIPYDRANTSMASFPMCEACREEYENPADRRFHAQPNACPDCGPRLWIEDNQGPLEGDPIALAAQAVGDGKILAVKGIGGFHLICDARNRGAVETLRARKHRPAKPFALMATSLDQIERYARIDEQEAALLTSAEAPIVLLDALPKNGLPEALAPGQNTLGFMLPYSPLHHLLLDRLDGPIVATSGNLGGLPPCTDDLQARRQLAGVADRFLMHDRDILNRVDDSVVRVLEGQTQILRRARGYAPAPIALPPGFERAPEVLAYGGELKNTFCLIKSGRAILSQHMGDLENLETFEDFERNLALYRQLFDHRPECLAVDLHPEYLSGKRGRDDARSQELPLQEVQHHHAHIAACLADNGWSLNDGAVIGIALDGIGMGGDGTLWGGEILLADYRSYRRLAHLAPTPLPGGAQAMREPWRNAVAHSVAAFGEHWQAQLGGADWGKLPVHRIEQMLGRGINCPSASSVGRLIDAVAAILGLCVERQYFEGQAALALENTTNLSLCQQHWQQAYPLQLIMSKVPWVIDPRSLWPGLSQDIAHGASRAIISARFHTGLARAFTEAAVRLAHKHRITHIALSGGVMQNRLLLPLMQQGITQAGLQPLIHRQVPANDGGLSLGQAVVAAARRLKESIPCA
ncbi:MAG: carbamoyltransferase HypF [Gammaproteobacteria bacterium]|nr:MAG: carbamoyltransferase HypF [Gammaproteobacteria bacterium]